MPASASVFSRASTKRSASDCRDVSLEVATLQAWRCALPAAHEMALFTLVLALKVISERSVSVYIRHKHIEGTVGPVVSLNDEKAGHVLLTWQHAGTP